MAKEPKTELKLWHKIFITIGIIATVLFVLFILMIGGGAFFLNRYWGHMPFFNEGYRLPFEEMHYFMDAADDEAVQVPGTSGETTSVRLSDDQKALLESFGVDPASVPEEIPSEYIECAERVLGEQRTQEIIDGATPTLSETLQLTNCFQ